MRKSITKTVAVIFSIIVGISANSCEKPQYDIAGNDEGPESLIDTTATPPGIVTPMVDGGTFVLPLN